MYTQYNLLCYATWPSSRTATWPYQFNQLNPKAPQYSTKKPDIDNYIKFYLDCMNKIVYLDDSQVIEITAIKQYTELSEDGHHHPSTVIDILNR